MERLPAKILIKVFGLIHQDDNVELQRVCHRWNELIKKYTLFNTLMISSQSVVDKFVKQIREKAIIASNIQQIAFDSGYDSELAVNEFQSLLPNLRILVSSISLDKRSDINAQYPWRESVQHLVDIVGIPEFSLNVFSSGICPSLPLLCVTIGRDLKNPTTSLACFMTDIHIMSDASRRRNLFLYVCKKYPNLEQLKFHTPFVRHCITLEDRAVHDAWELLDAGLKRLEPYLQDIDDDLFSDTDDKLLFEVLDASAFQLEHLGMCTEYRRTIKRLARSQQAHYIQTLALDSLDYSTFEWLNQLVVLEKLSLPTMSDSITKFNNILANVSSTLKSLTRKNYYLAFDRHYKDTSHIEALSFESVRFPNRMDFFIDQHFPKLTTLELCHSDIERKMWNLPSTSLLVLQLVFDYSGSSALVKTSNNIDSRVYSSRSNRYIVKHSRKFFELSFKSWPAHETNIKPDFTLHCHSLRTFLFKRKDIDY